MLSDNSLQSIVGVGAVTAYGWGVQPLIDGMESGKSAASLVPAEPPLLPDKLVWAARVPDGGLSQDGPTLFTRALRHAAREAVADAKARGWVPGDRVGLVLASTNGDWDSMLAVVDWTEGRPSRHLAQFMPGTWVSSIMNEFDFHGPSIVVGAACASGMQAMMVARDWLRLGHASDVLVLGVDLAATPRHIRFLSYWRVSVHTMPPQEACRPFSDGTHGFSEGEGAGAVVMTNQHPAAYLEVAAAAASSDGASWAAISDDHQHILRCVQQALEEAALDPRGVAMYHSHGTGTKACNEVEREILRLLSPSVRATTVKPLTGHCHPASAILETVLAAESHRLGRLLTSPAAPGADPQVVDGCVDWEPEPALQLAMGMGGHNAAMVLLPAVG
jgi:3-oxoacyl-[acyl-carrier-protein] synthase II